MLAGLEEAFAFAFEDAAAVVFVFRLGLGEELRLSCHSRRFSLAHEPHELKYAPAFWLAALTEACAWVMSTEARGWASVSIVDVELEGVGEVGVSIEVRWDWAWAAWMAFSSLRLR
jgi:hypothetical protein